MDKLEIITLTGDLGSGKSTVGKMLCDGLGYGYIYTGDILRNIAKRLGMTTNELNTYAETHKEIDEEVDSTFRGLNGARKLVVDSRLAWHFIPGSFKVYLQVQPEEAARRVLGDKVRIAESYTDIQEAMAQMNARRQSEIKRYKELYGIDCTDPKHFDLRIDTTTTPPDQVFQQIITAYQAWKK